MIFSESGSDVDVVRDFLCCAVKNLASDGVEIRILPAVPEHRVFNGQLRADYRAKIRYCRSLFVAVGVDEREASLVRAVGIVYKRLYAQLPAVLADAARGDVYSVRAVVVHGESAVRDFDKIDIAINAAVECEVRHRRVDGLVRRVVGSYVNAAAISDIVGDIDSERGISALVDCDKLVVDSDFRL